jgi:hypothetical protein
MKKILIPVVLIIVITGACLPVSAPPDSAPQVDTQATIDSIVNTAAAQTLDAQPSPTTAPATTTASPTATLPPTDITVTLSTTAAPNLTTTPATATLGTDNPTSQPNATGTQNTPSSGSITLTPTLGILKYGTLPPAVPSASITLVNKSKAEAYISLQNYPKDKEVAILEYPVKKQVSVDAPLGYYLYVVWVGGRKIVGEFVLHNSDDIKITIYKDKVTIQ